MHTPHVISCTAVGWWKWCWGGVASVAIVGGVIMLALAAVVHDASSIALLIIGGWWALVGVFALIQGRVRLARCGLNRVSSPSFSPARTWWCPPPRLRNFEEAGVT